MALLNPQWEFCRSCKGAVLFPEIVAFFFQDGPEDLEEIIENKCHDGRLGGSVG